MSEGIDLPAARALAEKLRMDASEFVDDDAGLLEGMAASTTAMIRQRHEAASVILALCEEIERSPDRQKHKLPRQPLKASGGED